MTMDNISETAYSDIKAWVITKTKTNNNKGKEVIMGYSVEEQSGL